jgi:hypothetical protein
MHSAGLGDGCERCGTREDGLIQVPIKNHCAISEPNGKEFKAGGEGNGRDLTRRIEINTL